MIPLLDYAEFVEGDAERFVRNFSQAARETGFFLLCNHGIGPAIRTEVFAQAEALFALPQEEKARISIAMSSHNRGYVDLGEERLDGARADRKEAFNIGLDLPADDPRVAGGEPFRGVNLWPDLPGFRESMLTYFEAIWSLGVDLHRAVARDLGQPEDVFAPHFTAPMATLRLLHYPASGPGEIGAGIHTDYGALTLLATDHVSGLQVRTRSGEWIDVPRSDGALVVNIGDCLMRWTNDIYVSTPHRVLPPKEERYSVAFFLDPNPDAVISALPGTGAAKYPDVTGADYLTSRLNATYAERA
ncbi:MAG: 2-oxoglutarate and iron-dependent oxygenase domain-containing protein [Pseudomonadota bacterium]